MILRFRQLPVEDRILVLRAAGAVTVTRIMLSVVPFSVLRRWHELHATRGELSSARPHPTAEKLAWAVKLTANRIPGATCLTQALALQGLLSRFGYSSELVIGVTKARQDFEAHAWVRCSGAILVGDNGGLADYAEILKLAL